MFKFIFKLLFGLLIFIILIVGVVMVSVYKNYDKSFSYEEIDMENLMLEQVNLGLDEINSDKKEDLEINITSNDFANLIYQTLKSEINELKEEQIIIKGIWIVIEDSKVIATIQIKSEQVVDFYTAISIEFKINLSDDLILSLDFVSAKLGKVSVKKSIINKFISWTNIDINDENEIFNLEDLSVRYDLKIVLRKFMKDEYIDIITKEKLIDVFFQNDKMSVMIYISKISNDLAAYPEYLILDSEQEYNQYVKKLVTKYMMQRLVENETIIKLSEEEFNQIIFNKIFKNNQLQKNIMINGVEHIFSLEAIYFEFLESKEILNLILKFDNIKILIKVNAEVKAFSNDKGEKIIKIELGEMYINDINIENKYLSELISKIKFEKADINGTDITIDIASMLSDSIKLNDIICENGIWLDVDFAEVELVNNVVNQVKNNLEIVKDNITDEEMKSSLENVIKAVNGNGDIEENINTFIEKFENLEQLEQNKIIDLVLENINEEDLNKILKMLGE